MFNMSVSKNKKWNEIKTNDSWSIFKIMGEFVEGYEKLSAIGPCISIFGSARTKPEDKYYKLAEEIAAEIVNRGYGVITGGGPGIMEAANKGANKNKGKSVGLCIKLPLEEINNKFIDKDKELIKFDNERTKMYENQFLHFFDCIEKDMKPLVTIDDGISAMRLINSILGSNLK